MSVKPRLKLRLDGRVEVLIPSAMRWTTADAKQRVVAQYGSLVDFAVRFGFRYTHVVDALRPGDYAVKQGGGIATVRQVLGLRSSPTATSEAQVAARARRTARQRALAQVRLSPLARNPGARS